MAPRSSAAALVLVLAACETAKVRPDLRPGEPVAVAVIVSPAKAPPPDGGLMLVNPLHCLEFAGLGLSTFGAILGILCIPVLGAVDLVALPVLIAARGEAKATTLAQTCGSGDPAVRAAEVFVDGLVSRHGMVRAGEPGSGEMAATTFRLEVSTERFLRSGTVSWSGRARFVDPAGDVVWEDECIVGIGKKAGESKDSVCDGAEAEVALLGDTCARRWLEAFPAPGVTGAARRG